MFNFNIAQWQAWAPGIKDNAHWQRWADDPYLPDGDSVPPSVDFLPAMQRRRLGFLARLVISCAWPLAEGRAPMPLVYCSHHGETSRTFKLLTDLAAHEPLSPTAFGLSVHNAIPGLWSILRQEHTETVSLSVLGDGLEHAFLEAALLLAQGIDSVLVVVADEIPPVPYTPWVDDVAFPYAAAFLVTAGQQIHLRRMPAERDAATPRWPHAVELVRHLILRSPRWQHPGFQGQQWEWQQAA